MRFDRVFRSDGACPCQHPARNQRRARGTYRRWTSSSIATTRAQPLKRCNGIDEFTGEHGGVELARPMTATAVIDLLENLTAVHGGRPRVLGMDNTRSLSAMS